LPTDKGVIKYSVTGEKLVVPANLIDEKDFFSQEHSWAEEVKRFNVGDNESAFII